MKPHLGFIVMALVWSVPLTSFAIWYVRRTDRQARRRLQIAFDQINRDTPFSTVGRVSPLVPDSRSHVQRDTYARGIRQFRSRSRGASRLASLVRQDALRQVRSRLKGQHTADEQGEDACHEEARVADLKKLVVNFEALAENERQ